MPHHQDRRGLKVGALLLCDGQPGNSLTDCARTAQELQEAGFHAIWHGDHIVFFDQYGANFPYSRDGTPPVGERQGMYDPLFVLAAAASTTSSIRLGVSVIILPQRNPLILAQQAVALDHLCGGRLDLGVGVGWSPEEFAALGVPFEQRGARADEYIEAMTTLWQDDLATYKGEFVTFENVVALPKPIQQPRVPIIVGGQTPAALRRAARLGDGWISWMLRPRDVPATLDRLRIELEEADRDPAGLRRVLMFLYSTPEALDEYMSIAEDNGVDEIAVAPWIPGRNPAEILAEIAEVAGLRSTLEAAGSQNRSHGFRTDV